MSNQSKQITKDEYDKLLSFIGYGNLLKSNLIIFGNEEGAGRFPVRENVNVRNQFYGTEHGDYKYCLDQEWDTGFWEPSSAERTKIALTFLDPDGTRKDKSSNSDFLNTIARFCLALEDSKSNINSWFESFPKNTGSRDKIKEYVEKSLFKPRDGIQTFLADWRPLPRPTQNWWEDEYYPVFDPNNGNSNPYLNAFSFKSVSQTTDLFSDFPTDVSHRLTILKKAFSLSPSNIIIGLGEASGIKKTVFKEMYQLKERDFRQLDIEFNNPKNLKSFQVEVQLETKKLHIFLLPFPDTGNVFTNNEAMFDFYRGFTEKYLANLI